MSVQRNDVKDGAIFVTNDVAVDKHRGLLDVISAIQHYYVAERNGNDIDPNFLTLKGQLNFYIVGFKIGLLVGTLELLLTPIMFGVIDKFIPIFGTYSPSYVDMAIAFVISSCFSLALILLLLLMGKYYIGSVTKLAIKEFLAGLSCGVVLKSILIFILFHLLYFKFLVASNIIPFFQFFSKAINNYNIANKLYVLTLNIRNVLIPSAYYIVTLGILTIVIPIVSIFIRSKKEQERKDIDREAWSS